MHKVDDTLESGQRPGGAGRKTKGQGDNPARIASSSFTGVLIGRILKTKHGVAVRDWVAPRKGSMADFGGGAPTDGHG